MKIPFVDLHAQYLSIKEEVDNAIADTIRETAFIGGGRIKQFEEAFAAYLGVKHVVACANGTDSLEMLMQAMGIGKGDEVIIPALSWISTGEIVGTAGATPVFVDIEEEFFTLDPDLIEAAITPRTKAIIPVHLYGQAANMPAIMAIAKKHGLKVIEDCAQSHGAMIDGQMTGTFGDAASYSFYPGKNLGAYGDAGCVATNDTVLADMVRMIANHGQKGKHNHQMEGRNSRLDGLQAAILSAKLPHLGKWTQARIENAKAYDGLLSRTGVACPQVRPNSRHVFHLYVVRSNDRAALQKMLTEQGIETSVHYPTAMPFMPCYAHFGHTEADFPVAAEYQHKILSLPMYPELTREQMKAVSAAIEKRDLQSIFS